MGIRRSLPFGLLLVMVLLLAAAGPAAAHPRAVFPTQSLGSTGVDVLALQHLLRGRGYPVAADSVFGGPTQAAVASFQKAARLTANGVANSATWEQLVPSLSQGATAEAVTALKTLLNVKRNAGLGTVATFDALTREAVSRFQAHMGLPQTGIVITATWRNLLWHYVRPAFSMPELCNYNGGSATADWGTATATTLFGAAAALFHQRTGAKVAVGDVSFEHGGNIRLHATHEVGLDFDVALVRKDRNQCSRPGIGYGSAQYDRNATRQLIRALLEAAPQHLKLIYFNDPVLIGEGLVQRFPNHNDHIHVRYCEVGSPAERYHCAAPGFGQAASEAPPAPIQQDSLLPVTLGIGPI